MTPVLLAKLHCANWDHGACLGIYYNDDLSIQCCRPLPACLLADPIQRCPYFEDVVMKITVDQSTLTGAKQKEAFDEGVREYRLATGLLKSETDTSRPCPECKQRPLEEGKKLCYVCRNKHRQETHKAYNRSRGK